ncbi:MAG TPA: hypothetical protein VGF91_15915 [Solirubrobacteraceae bacterium]
MRVARVGFARVALAAGAVLGLTALGGAPAAAWPGQHAPTAALQHAFKVNVYPAYATAGLQTTFEVTVANTSSRATTLQSLQITPPTGFTVAHPSPTSPLRRKTFVQKRTFSLHQISLKPGHKLQFNVTATAPTKCGSGARRRWTSHAFEGSSPSGPQLALQTAASSVGVIVVCPQLAPCGDGGPACSTSVKTSVSTYGVISDAAAGTLRGTLDVGRQLRCGAYRFRDPNWYDSVVTPPAGATAPPAGTPPIVDQVSYTIVNAGSQGLGFCLGALYDFATASGAMARPGKLPNGNAGFIGLLPMCSAATPPCISSISQQSDPNTNTGYDAVMSIQIPERGDPWGGG